MLWALMAIILWASLAVLGLALAHWPPFLLTGLSLLLGGLLSLPHWRQWRVPLRTLLLGVYGLFGFHFLLFMALRHAPPIEANLINYLWPLLIVLLTPLFLPGHRLRAVHVLAAVLGFAGAALAIVGGRQFSLQGSGVGFALAGCSALVWASYSLASRRVPPFPTAAVGGFCMVSAALALLCHGLWEPAVVWRTVDGVSLLLLGLGPMGAAFYLWDRALKQGDPRRIGVLANLTPLLSTVALHLWTGRPLSGQIGLAAVLISGAASLVWWSGRRTQSS